MKKIAKYLIAIAMIVAVIGVAIFWINSPHSMEEAAYCEFIKIGTDITVEELEEEGYVDVTDTMDEPDEQIEKFLKKAANKKKAVLKTCQMTEEGIRIIILYYEEKINRICTAVYYPSKQAGEAPSQRYEIKPAYNRKDGIISVVLKNVKQESMPIENQELVDVTLYSYRENKKS